MKELVIFGTSTLAKLATYYATQELGLKVIAFVVDEKYLGQRTFLMRPVLTWDEFLNTYPIASVMVHAAVGYKSMRSRALVFNRLTSSGYSPMNLISSASYIANDVTVGENNFVMPGVVLETGVRLGSNNVIWSNVTICHDTTMGDHNFIAANTTIGGEANIGNGNFLGFSSVVLQNLQIGNEVLVSAGALVTHNAFDLCRIQGSPAKVVGFVDAHHGIKIGQ